MQHSWVACSIRVEHRSDGISGNTGLSGVGDDAAALERGLERGRQRQSSDACLLAEREAERATVRRCIVVLPSAGHVKIFDLDRAALFGERSSFEWRATP